MMRRVAVSGATRASRCRGAVAGTRYVSMRGLTRTVSPLRGGKRFDQHRLVWVGFGVNSFLHILTLFTPTREHAGRANDVGLTGCGWVV
eukprot:6141590-Prymnesium_polylepis.1